MQVRERLEQGQVPKNKYVITKQLTKNPKDYPDARNQPHVQVALRRQAAGKRDGVMQVCGRNWVIEWGAQREPSLHVGQRACCCFRSRPESLAEAGRDLEQICRGMALQHVFAVVAVVAAGSGRSATKSCRCAALHCWM